MSPWFYIHAHERRLLRQPGIGDSRRLWYVVLDVGRVNRKNATYSSCSFSSFSFGCIQLQHCLQKILPGMILRSQNVHVFLPTILHLQCMSAGRWRRVGLTRLSLGWVTSFSRDGVSTSPPPTHTKVNLVDASVSPTLTRLSWTWLGS